MLKLKKFFILFFIPALLISFTANAQDLPKNAGRKVFPSPSPDDDKKEGVMPAVEGIALTSPAFPIVMVGRQKIAERRYAEAIEAFRTAIRLEPMNPIIWGLYDNAVTEDYMSKENNSLLNGAVTASLKPLFKITETNSYIQINTLCIVGHLKNLSNIKKQKIVLAARVFDKNKRELAKGEGTLRNYDKSLLPNELCVFEIDIKDYPKGITDYKVEVIAWE